MTEEQKKNMEKKIMYLSFGVLGLAVVFLIIVGVTGQAETLLFPIGLAVFLAIYWVISDLLPIKWANILEEKTDEQKQAYQMYALLDLGGLAGLVYFIINMESLIGVIIFAFCTMYKRKQYDKFLGKTEDAEDVSEAEAEESAEVTASEAEESAEVTAVEKDAEAEEDN